MEMSARRSLGGRSRPDPSAGAGFRPASRSPRRLRVHAALFCLIATVLLPAFPHSATGWTGDDGATVEYTARDTEDDGPPFGYLTSSSWILLVSSAQRFYTPLPESFDFRFYGTARGGTDLYVHEDGILVFENTGATDTPAAIPSASAPNAFIAGYWTDLCRYGAGAVACPQGTLQTQGANQMGHMRVVIIGDVGERVYIVEFVDMGYAESPATVNMQIQLYETTDAIEVHYLDAQPEKDACSQPSAAGIEKAGGGKGVQYWYYTGSCTSTPVRKQDVAIQYRPVDSYPIADDDSYVLDVSGGATDLLVDGSTLALPRANDMQVGSVPAWITYDAGSLTGGSLEDLAGAPDAIGGPGGGFRFTPDAADPCGTYSFRYWLDDTWTNDTSSDLGYGRDTAGFTNRATVTIQVIGCGTAAPVAEDDFVSLREDTSPTLDVLANDTDDDGDPLTITSFDAATAQGGSVTLDTNDTADPADDRLVYTPPAHYVGPDSFNYTVSDGNSGTDNATVHLTVLPVDDPPAFAPGAGISLDEDDPAQEIAWATGIGPGGGADEAGQDVLLAIISNDNPGLFTSLGQPRIDGTADPAPGTLRFAPAPHANGVANLIVRARDSGTMDSGGLNESAPVSLTITIDAVNDAPSFTPGGNVSVVMDASPWSTLWATAIDPGPPDEEAVQEVGFTVVSNDNPGLFDAAGPPRVDGTADAAPGTLRFTPAAGISGTANLTIQASDTGGKPNGGEDTGPAHPLTIRVFPPGDVPVAPVARDDFASLREDSSLTVDVLANDTDDNGDPLSITSFDASSTRGGSIALDTRGTPETADDRLVYTPPLHHVGPDTFGYTISDGNGGIDNATVRLDVLSVNDAPTITAGPDITLSIDAAAQVFSAWATGIAAGPPDEGNQTLSVSLDVSDAGLFAALPELDLATGNLSFEPAAGRHGTAEVTIRLGDDGGTARDGLNATTVRATIHIRRPDTGPAYVLPLILRASPTPAAPLVQDPPPPVPTAPSPFAEAENLDPVAHVTAPREARPGELVLLDGRGSYDPDGDVLNHSWRQTAGPAVVLLDADTAVARFVAPVGLVPAVVGFALRVDDGQAADEETFTLHLHGHSPRDPRLSIELDVEGMTVRAASSVPPWADSYVWSFGDGTRIHEEAAAHAYAAPGSYLVALRVLDEEGGMHEAVQTVKVQEPAAPLQHVPAPAAPGPGPDAGPARATADAPLAALLALLVAAVIAMAAILLLRRSRRA